MVEDPTEVGKAAHQLLVVHQLHQVIGARLRLLLGFHFPNHIPSPRAQGERPQQLRRARRRRHGAPGGIGRAGGGGAGRGGSSPRKEEEEEEDSEPRAPRSRVRGADEEREKRKVRETPLRARPPPRPRGVAAAAASRGRRSPLRASSAGAVPAASPFCCRCRSSRTEPGSAPRRCPRLRGGGREGGRRGGDERGGRALALPRSRRRRRRALSAGAAVVAAALRRARPPPLRLPPARPPALPPPPPPPPVAVSVSPAAASSLLLSSLWSSLQFRLRWQQRQRRQEEGRGQGPRGRGHVGGGTSGGAAVTRRQQRRLAEPTAARGQLPAPGEAGGAGPSSATPSQIPRAARSRRLAPWKHARTELFQTKSRRCARSAGGEGRSRAVSRAPRGGESPGATRLRPAFTTALRDAAVSRCERNRRSCGGRCSAAPRMRCRRGRGRGGARGGAARGTVCNR